MTPLRPTALYTHLGTSILPYLAIIMVSPDHQYFCLLLLHDSCRAAGLGRRTGPCEETSHQTNCELRESRRFHARRPSPSVHRGKPPEMTWESSKNSPRSENSTAMSLSQLYAVTLLHPAASWASTGFGRNLRANSPYFVFAAPQRAGVFTYRRVPADELGKGKPYPRNISQLLLFQRATPWERLHS